MNLRNENTSNHAPTPPIEKSCDQISAMFGINSTHTDIQKTKVWREKFRHRAFEWKLVVQDVINDGKDFTIITKCQNSTSLIGDVYIKVSWIAKKYVSNIRKGEIYHFSGALMEYNILGSFEEQ